MPTEGLASQFGIEVDWQGGPDDVDTISTRPVEALLFNMETTDALAMVQQFQRVRSVRPNLPIMISIAWRGKVLAVAEVRSYHTLHERDARRLGLTPRESQVLDQVRSGETNREIAVKLGMSVSTVNRHVENILHKLHARNRTAAAVSAPEVLP